MRPGSWACCMTDGQRPARWPAAAVLLLLLTMVAATLFLDFRSVRPDSVRWYSEVSLSVVPLGDKHIQLGRHLPESAMLDLEDTNPCVLRNDRGYLIQFWNSTHDEPGLEGTSLRLLLFVPLTAWTDLRGKHGLSLKEMVHAAWGYADAYETWRSWRFYGLEIPTEKGKTATAV